MNNIWSSCVQGPKTLYYSRRLRFDDRYAKRYQDLFSLDEGRPIKILEIGCGPGALAGALHRWYPNAEITALDRDIEFVEFARRHEPGVTFVEGDATALPFEESSFDVTISNTVCEHIEPSKFYGEQMRVLKPGGVCLVLSSRKSIVSAADCVADGTFEKEFWEKASHSDDVMERYKVCRYPMSEAGLPAALERYGFSAVQTGYVTVELTPDNPDIPAELAHDMINSARYTALEAVERMPRTCPGRYASAEIDAMVQKINAKYDERMRQYDSGEKQWDTTVSVLMVVRGEVLPK